jgi:PKD repeat protein
VTPSAGTKTQPVTANAQFSWDATGIVSYQFNWGDGILDPPQTSPMATHLYPAGGTYRITVTVVDRVGLASSDWKNVTLT